MPSDPLPDFGVIDITEIASTTTHPILAAVSAELLAWWPTADQAVAAYDDSPPTRSDTGKKVVRSRPVVGDNGRFGDWVDSP
jgi:hypothetical protein